MIEASSEPKNRGRNIAIVVSAGALVGLALAPVLTTQIGARFGWRAAFFVVGLPGLLLGLLIWRFVKEPGEADPDSPHHAKPSLADYLSLLRIPNMRLYCAGAAGFMTWLFVMHVFAPLYITEITKRTATMAGFIVGAGGLGAFVWGWLFPWVSDHLGRKRVLIFLASISALAPLTFQVP